VVKEYRRDTSPSGDTNPLVSVWNVKSTTIGPFRLGQKAFCRRIKSLAVARIDTVPPKRLKGSRMVKDKSRSFPDQDDIQRKHCIVVNCYLSTEFCQVRLGPKVDIRLASLYVASPHPVINICRDP